MRESQNLRMWFTILNFDLYSKFQEFNWFLNIVIVESKLNRAVLGFKILGVWTLKRNDKDYNLL